MTMADNDYNGKMEGGFVTNAVATVFLLSVLPQVVFAKSSEGDEVLVGLPHIRQVSSVNPDNLQHQLENGTRSAAVFPSETLSRGEVTENEHCPSGVDCYKLGGDCLNCTFNKTCIYGAEMNVTCEPKPGISCKGPTTFQRTMICRYCYQTEKWEHVCTGSSLCRVVTAPRSRYITNCTVKSEILCLGRRKFLKNPLCNYTSGYKWTTALILSITLGGFGADRFYLGHWQEGIGKLFSFGGLGVWTIVDVILIAIGYLGPEDGSLYLS